MKPEEMNDLGDPMGQMNPNAVSVYGNDSADDFPVLKAFQQYIDAEQNKARKRLMMICTFFGFLMVAVMSVFIVMLSVMNQRNQTLNDRLVEYAMKDRDRDRQAAVVVQPPVQQDSSAILQLTTQMRELQQKMADSQRQADEAVRAKDEALKIAKEATLPKTPSKDELEIRRLKGLLAAEKEKMQAEKERQHQEELEAYRRKHYPELYAKPKSTKRTLAEKRRKLRELLEDEDDDLDEDLLDDEEEEEIVRPKKKAAAKKIKIQDDDESLDDDDAIDYFKEEKTSSGKKSYTIPVEVKGSSNRWRIED